MNPDAEKPQDGLAEQRSVLDQYPAPQFGIYRKDAYGAGYDNIEGDNGSDPQPLEQSVHRVNSVFIKHVE